MIRPSSNLRERKKALTRQLIADVALRLTLEKGLTHVTLEDIGREAVVSPRTVSNYFSHKEQAIVAAGALSTIDIVTRLLDRPEAENQLLALNRVMIDLVNELSQDQLDLQRQKLALADTYPVVKSFLAASYQELEEALSIAVAGRTATNATYDLYPRLLAAAAVAAFRLSLEVWSVEDTDAYTLAEAINTAFSTIQMGFPSL